MRIAALAVNWLGIAAVVALLMRRVPYVDPALLVTGFFGVLPLALALIVLSLKTPRFVLFAALVVNLALILAAVLFIGWTIATPGERGVKESVLGFALAALPGIVNLVVLFPRGWNKGSAVWWNTK